MSGRRRPRAATSLDPPPQAPNIRAPRYCLAESSRDCLRCAHHKPVFAIALPPGHQELCIEDGPADDHWEPVDLAALLLYIADMPEPIPTRLRLLAPRYRIDFTQGTESFYWMNHCEHCDAKLGDFDTIDGYNTAFNPMTPEGAAAIQLHEFAEPLIAYCPSQTYGLDWPELALHGRPLSRHAPRGKSAGVSLIAGSPTPPAGRWSSRSARGRP
jgi:hypothetical protein